MKKIFHSIWRVFFVSNIQIIDAVRKFKIITSLFMPLKLLSF